MVLKSLEDMVEAVREVRPRPMVAVARSAEEFVLRAAREAYDRGVADFLLIGDADKTRAVAGRLGIDITPFDLIHETDDAEAVALAIAEYKAGRVSLIMKGLIATNVLLKGVLDKKRGAPPKGVLSHATVFESPERDRLMVMSDAGVNIKPTMQRKADILHNALSVARALGIERPRTAVLAATEKVNFQAMPATLDAAVLTRMAEQGEFGDARVFGPMALDIAVSPKSARLKGVGNEVAGNADVLLVPTIESGNILYKTLGAFFGVPLASVVVGSEVPVVVPSRADSERSKFYSIALASYLAARARGGSA